MKDDHIAYLPYAWPRCTTVKIHWYRHAMRQIENFDFDPQNKIRICCLARSLQARLLRQQLAAKLDIATGDDMQVLNNFYYVVFDLFMSISISHVYTRDIYSNLPRSDLEQLVL